MLLIEYCIRGIYGWEIDESLSAEGDVYKRQVISTVVSGTFSNTATTGSDVQMCIRDSMEVHSCRK